MELRREIGNREVGVVSPSRIPGPDYLVAFACLACHRSFKRPIDGEAYIWYRKCPHCCKWAINLGRHFEPPKKAAVSQWKKVELLVNHGFVFQRVYGGESGGRVRYPETLEEARSFVVKYAAYAIEVPPPPAIGAADS